LPFRFDAGRGGYDPDRKPQPHARGDQHPGGWGKAAQERGEREATEPPEEDVPAAEEISGPSSRRPPKERA
jgi:hypothetical protein